MRKSVLEATSLRLRRSLRTDKLLALKESMNLFCRIFLDLLKSTGSSVHHSQSCLKTQCRGTSFEETGVASQTVPPLQQLEYPKSIFKSFFEDTHKTYLDPVQQLIVARD
ncbi:hypothetical protein J6590_063729 [Homalodisca vitripennis]|nr:hypothetical protein J6590_063729 [Homalodisca vitripennis]